MLYSLHLAGLVVVVLLSVLVAWWVHTRTRDRAGTVMTVLLVLYGAMATLALVQLLGSSLEWQAFWNRLGTSLGFASTVAWFLLAVYYAGHERWLTRPVWGVVIASAIVSALAVLTDPIHGYVVADYAFETDPFARVIPRYTGVGFAMYFLMGFYFLIAFGLFVRLFLFPRRHSRWQPGAVLVGMVAMYVTMALGEAPFLPAPGFPYAIYGSGVFAALVAVALFRTRFFAVTPLAHETIFESIDDAILVVDARRTIVDFNEPATEYFPDLEARVGDSLEEAYPALLASDGSSTDGGGAAAIVERLEGSVDSPFAGLVRVSHVDGSRTLRIGVSEITYRDEPRGHVLIMRDVTELEEYALELEHKTDQLERFASVISHDLRNPVSVGIGYVELVEETGDLRHVREVRSSLERIDETIDDLMTLSREGRSIDETDVVSLRSLVDDAWSTTDTRAVELANEVDPAYLIRADPSRTRTMLENLFRNAADHGGETVRVEALATGPGFAVADDGPGIPEDERERVFEYGYTSNPDGTGLGLSIVTSIATAHGWSLSVTESEDGGARFEVENVERVYETDTWGDGAESDADTGPTSSSIPDDSTPGPHVSSN